MDRPLSLDIDKYNHDILSLQRLYIASNNYQLNYLQSIPEARLLRMLDECAKRKAYKTVSCKTNQDVGGTTATKITNDEVTIEHNVESLKNLNVSDDPYDMNRVFDDIFPRRVQNSIFVRYGRDDINVINRDLRNSNSVKSTIDTLYGGQSEDPYRFSKTFDNIFPKPEQLESVVGYGGEPSTFNRNFYENPLQNVNHAEKGRRRTRRGGKKKNGNERNMPNERNIGYPIILPAAGIILQGKRKKRFDKPASARKSSVEN